jgi:hypothetical protein
VTELASQSRAWSETRNSFDVLFERAEASRVSFDEEDLLRNTHWNLGQDARLREDVRFRPTPWGRWIPSKFYLANGAFFVQLQREPQHSLDLERALADLEQIVKRRCAFCQGDPRFVLEGSTLRLAARELTNQPLLEPDVGDLEKYVTHLPVHSLRAAAASLPAGEWGKGVRQEEVIETLGWLRVSVGRKLNNRMFVAQIEGKSMDDGRSGLVDGGYAVFELWPSGTRQLLNVLVRGAFSDPETGSYAVKKYVADERDEEGWHRRIALVSLNPDKERYPDIELEVEDDQDVTVVAKVVQALSLEQFARRPRALRRAGRRDLSSSEAVAEIASDLEASTARFFEDLPEEGKVDAEEERRSWSSQLVCLEAEAGGLHVEIGPLVGLWSFVKQLRVRGSSWEACSLASNLRLRSVRIAVAPATGPWRWEAVGFEDDGDIDLSALASAAVPADVPVAFRVDAAGVGRRIAGRVLSGGQHYRLLISDRVLATLARKLPATASSPGWQIWEVDLSSPVDPDVHACLRELGVEIGESEAQLEWTLVPPVDWRATPRGASYPCFLADPAPVLYVRGPEIEFDGAASLFLCGAKGNDLLPLPAGGQHLVQLRDLAPGRYSALALHDRTGIAPERVHFEILDAVPEGPPARWEIWIGNEHVSPSAGAVTVVPARDLAEIGTPVEAPETQVLSVVAPPGWPVRVSWRELAEDLVLSANADSAGAFDTNAVLVATHDRRTRRALADLVLDLGELGAAVLRHERRPTPNTIRHLVEELLATRGAVAQRLAGAYAELLPIWFEPICSVLGYDVEPIDLPEAAEAPDHVAAFRLLHTERLDAYIERHPTRILLLVEDLTGPLPAALVGWLDGLCASEGLRDALISDGIRWASHRRAARLAPRVWDLTVASKEPEEFVEFLRAASEGL